MRNLPESESFMLGGYRKRGFAFIAEPEFSDETLVITSSETYLEYEELDNIEVKIISWE